MRATLDSPLRRTTTPLRVLLVDEPTDDRDRIVRVLRERLGREVEITLAEEADDALAIVLRRPIDVVLLEYPRPAWDGVDLLAEMAALGDETAIVLLTAAGNPIVPADALRRGADAYVCRSDFSAADLVRQVEAIRRERDSRRQAQVGPLPLRELAEHLQRVEACLQDQQRLIEALAANNPAAVR